MNELSQADSYLFVKNHNFLSIESMSCDPLIKNQCRSVFLHWLSETRCFKINVSPRYIFY